MRRGPVRGMPAAIRIATNDALRSKDARTQEMQWERYQQALLDERRYSSRKRATTFADRSQPGIREASQRMRHGRRYRGGDEAAYARGSTC
jgi:hypothetical protein